MRILRSALILGVTALSASAGPMTDIIKQYSIYDWDHDGVAEIKDLSPIYGAGEVAPDAIPASMPLVIVAVESRLLDVIPNETHSLYDLEERLARFKGDLKADGMESLVISADLFNSDNVDPSARPTQANSDGATLMGFRRFLKAVKAKYPKLEGVILVGSFPEATIVRKWGWPWPSPNGKIGSVVVGNKNLVTIGPDLIAPSTDIPLADLDGNWDQVYYKKKTALQGILCLPLSGSPPLSDFLKNTNFLSKYFQTYTNTYEDFFYINDAQYSVTKFAGKTIINFKSALRNAEVSATDLTRPFPMAMPDLYVSRINAASASWDFDPDFRDPENRPAYDQFGNPQSFTGPAMPAIIKNPDREREMLLKFFDDDHAFRTGAFADQPFRSGAATDPESQFSVAGFAGIVAGARTDFAPQLNTPANATLADFVGWMEKPVTLRMVMAHSASNLTDFASATPNRLNATVGVLHYWTQQDGIWVPSWNGDWGQLNFGVLNSVTKNHRLDATPPSLMIHGGCDMNTAIDKGATLPYNRYGWGQIGESMLFHGRVLGMMARAKVYFDYPSGWQSYMSQHSDAKFGDIWKQYYQSLSGRTTMLADDIAGCKRNYWWSTIGDYTLRLRNDGGFTLQNQSPDDRGLAAKRTFIQGGLMRGSNQAENFSYTSSTRFVGRAGQNGSGFLMFDSRLGLTEVQYDGFRFDNWGSLKVNASAGSWKFQATDAILGTGDVNGDGYWDFLIRSQDKLGLLTWDGTAYSLLWSAPNGSTLPGNPGWTLNPSLEFYRIADLDGDGRAEIVITASGKLGVVGWDPNLNSLRTLSVSSPGAAFADDSIPGTAWTWTSSDFVEGFGRFVSGSFTQMLVHGPEGMACLRWDGNKFHASQRVPSGVSLGEWRYSGGDRILGIGDYSGDRNADVIIQSAWGIGIIEFGHSPYPVASMLVPNGGSLGMWPVASGDRVVASGDFTGDGRDDFFLKNGTGWGLGTLGVNGKIGVTKLIPFGSVDHGWLLKANDKVTAVGDFDSNVPGQEMLIIR